MKSNILLAPTAFLQGVQRVPQSQRYDPDDVITLGVEETRPNVGDASLRVHGVPFPRREVVEGHRILAEKAANSKIPNSEYKIFSKNNNFDIVKAG